MTNQNPETVKWSNAIREVAPHIFRIFTQKGNGTGFQISYSQESGLCGVATALHVIRDEQDWEQPIRLVHHQTGGEIMLHANERAVIQYPKLDLAFILFHSKEMNVQEKSLPLLQEDIPSLAQGIQIGWVGFPAVYDRDLCFFSGYISSHDVERDTYLVDGVAINGVSGGPAFFRNPVTDQVEICGVISSYLPNRFTSTGETMPGLSAISSIRQYYKTLQDLKDFEAAQKKANQVVEEEDNIEE